MTRRKENVLSLENAIIDIHCCVVSYFEEVIMINQQPTVANSDQPSIAIITVNYYEKLAVDAMMSNKVTFVRHKPEGKTQRCSTTFSFLLHLFTVELIRHRRRNLIYSILQSYLSVSFLFRLPLLPFHRTNKQKDWVKK